MCRAIDGDRFETCAYKGIDKRSPLGPASVPSVYEQNFGSRTPAPSREAILQRKEFTSLQYAEFPVRTHRSLRRRELECCPLSSALRCDRTSQLDDEPLQPLLERQF